MKFLRYVCIQRYCAETPKSIYDRSKISYKKDHWSSTDCFNRTLCICLCLCKTLVLLNVTQH